MWFASQDLMNPNVEPWNAEPPAYHSGLLLVQLRDSSAPNAAGPMGAMTAGNARAAVGAIPAANTLMAFERAGIVRRVIPLSEASSPHTFVGESPMMAAMAAAMMPDPVQDPIAGSVMVEVSTENDLAGLQAQLQGDPSVQSYSRVPIRYLQAKRAKKAAQPVAPAAAAPAPSTMWNLNKVRWQQARSRPGFRDANNVKVAVLDTGIDTSHPDLQGVIAGYEFAHPTNPVSSNRDIIGHGTHVAGTIAARINNSVGINGVCTCQIFAQKIFDDVPDFFPRQGYFAYFVNPVMYLRALSRCLTLGINVINLSIGGPGAPSSQERQLFNALLQRGVSIVAAMGNENTSQLSYPAAIPGVIAVGATSINDTRAIFGGGGGSNFGAHISVCAPGKAIWSTLPRYPGNQGYYARPTLPPTPDFNRPLSRDVDYAAWDGTSMASPHVAGAAALVLANRGPMTGAQVKARLEAKAVKIPAMAGQPFTIEYGHGRLDLFSLLS